MASQLLSAMKFGILAAVAFFGPKWITESGEYLGRVEKRMAPSYRHEKSLIQPGEMKEKPDSDTPATDLMPGSGDLKPGSADLNPISGNLKTGSEEARGDKAGSSAGILNSEVQPDSSAAFTVRRPNSGPAVSPVPVVPLERAIRFDLSPAHITAVWPNVTADDFDPPSRGYRVPLLTGTASDDLAGALCYWYERQRLERITFTGQTGDFRKILPFLEFRYGMVLDGDSTPGIYRYLAADAGSPLFGPLRSEPLHSKTDRSKSVSQLTIQPSAQFDTARPDRNYTVSFELFRP